MRKLKLFFACLLMTVLSIGQVWAAEEEAYTLEVVATGGNTPPHNSYTAAATTTIDGIEWSVLGNSNQSPWRLGGKGNNCSGADRDVHSNTAISDNISKIEITHGTASNITVNSMTVIVSKNSDFSSPVSTLTPEFVASDVVTVTRPEGKDWSNCYFKFVYNLSVSGNSNRFVQFSGAVFYKEQAASDVATPTFSPAAGVYTSAQSVTLSCETASSTIYYTTDGSDPDNTKTQYTGAINVDETTTIKAIAYVGSSASNVASATYTIVTPLATMQDIFDASATAGNYYITFSSDWVVTGISPDGKNAYITDGTKGMILYNNGGNMDLVAGNTLSGTKQCSLTRYGGAAEITTFSIAGLTKDDGTLPAVQELDAEGIAALSPVNTGALIKVSGVYTSAGYIADVKLYNVLSELPSMTAGATYNCTGVYIYYKKNNNTAAVNEIAPRSASDIAEVQAATLDEVTGLAALKAEAVNMSYYVNLTNAIVTYVNGKNAYIEDATAGALIYFDGHNLNAGDCLNGKYQVTTTLYQGKFEITAMEAQTGAATTTADIPLTVLTIAELNADFAAYESRRVKIADVVVTNGITTDDRKGEISKETNTLILYAAINGVTAAENANIDIVGYPTPFVTNTTDEQQFFVWEQDNITVNASEPPVVDTRKVAESPAAGFSSISGDLSGNEISFAAYQGGAATAPNGSNKDNELRLYKYQATTEYGGYLTITAKSGCTIDQVVITVGANCNVGWCKDAEEFPTKESTPISVGTSSPFDTGEGLGAQSVNVINLDGSNQFKIKTITVYYTGEAITLQSIAIGGTATALEYNDGDEFDPAGLVVTGHYSDNSDAVISEGITWEFDPATLTVGTTSVSVTATVGSVTSDAVVVNGLTVSAASTPAGQENVVILAMYDSKYYAMSTNYASSAFGAIAVEYDGTQVTVPSEEAKTAIQWTKTTEGDNTTFQTKGETPMYMKGTSDGAALTLNANVCNWSWDATNEYYYIGSRTFFYQNTSGGVFKNYATSNLNKTGYSDKAQVIVIDPANIVVVVPTTYTLSYNSNGGTLISGETEIAPAQVAEGATVTVAANVYEKEDYMFAGWLYGETVYQAGQTFDMPTEDVELVAQWAAISTDDVVILAKCQGQWYAVQGVAGASNHTVAAVPVVYQDNVIYLVESKRASITWERTTAGSLASFKNGENYLSGKTSDSNDLDLSEDECWWTYTDQNIYQTHASHSILYSSQVGLFKNYKTSNKSEDGESGNYSALPIVVPAVFGNPSYTTVREELAPNAYYTMCLEKAVDAVQGGSVWKIVSKAQGSLDIILEEVTGTLQAGRPYIFYATSDIFKVVYAGSAVLEPVNDNDNNGLVGSFSQTHIDNVNTNYIIYNNELYYVNTDNVYVGAHRAYIDMTVVPDYSEPQQGNAPRRRVTMHTNAPQVATGVDALNASETPVKVIIEGKLYIIRGEKMFNANGQLVK